MLLIKSSKASEIWEKLYPDFSQNGMYETSQEDIIAFECFDSDEILYLLECINELDIPFSSQVQN